MKTYNQKLSEMIPAKISKNYFHFQGTEYFSKISFKTIFMFHDGLNDILKKSKENCSEESKILLKTLKI